MAYCFGDGVEEQGRTGTQAAAFIGAWGSLDLGMHAKASSLAAGRWPCWPRPLVAGWAALGCRVGPVRAERVGSGLWLGPIR
jgi:hypothetical protein